DRPRPRGRPDEPGRLRRLPPERRERCHGAGDHPWLRRVRGAGGGHVRVGLTAIRPKLREASSAWTQTRSVHDETVPARTLPAPARSLLRWRLRLWRRRPSTTSAIVHSPPNSSIAHSMRKNISPGKAKNARPKPKYPPQ